MHYPAHPYTREELASLLEFYAESGLDFPIEADPIDRFASKTKQNDTPAPSPAASAPVPDHAARAAPPPPNTAETVPVMSDTQAVALANAAAAQASTLDELVVAAAAFDGCSLKRSARHMVFEGGAREVDLMLVLDAPSRDDDTVGAPFQGEAGRLLKAMLAAIGLDRDTDVYAGFCVPWHPPGGQPPMDRHMQMCRPFLERQITLAAPKVLLILGNTAAQSMLGAKQTIMRLRGGPHEIQIGNQTYAAFATFDPKFLLGEPSQKRNAWFDLLSLKAHLGGAD